jgi:fructose-1,6-bisphosphatase/inositol monophosphatase family enzyme
MARFPAWPWTRKKTPKRSHFLRRKRKDVRWWSSIRSTERSTIPEARATVVHFPAWDETYWAQRGRGCWRRRGKLDPERVQVSDSGNVVLASPRVPTSWRESLSQAGFDVSVSRCSAVDSALPATARGIASVTRHRPDRRRALPLLLTTEAGGVVTWGERPWEGEDPRVDGEGPCVAACSRAIADRVRDAVAAAAR